MGGSILGKMVDQAAQMEQVVHAKQGSACRHRDKRILRSGVGIAGRNRDQIPLVIVEIYSVLSPATPVKYQFKLVAVERVEWMRDMDRSCTTLSPGCSR